MVSIYHPTLLREGLTSILLQRSALLPGAFVDLVEQRCLLGGNESGGLGSSSLIMTDGDLKDVYEGVEKRESLCRVRTVQLISLRWAVQKHSPALMRWSGSRCRTPFGHQEGAPASPAMYGHLVCFSGSTTRIQTLRTVLHTF